MIKEMTDMAVKKFLRYTKSLTEMVIMCIITKKKKNPKLCLWHLSTRHTASKIFIRATYKLTIKYHNSSN